MCYPQTMVYYPLTIHMLWLPYSVRKICHVLGIKWYANGIYGIVCGVLWHNQGHIWPLFAIKWRPVGTFIGLHWIFIALVCVYVWYTCTVLS